MQELIPNRRQHLSIWPWARAFQTQDCSNLSEPVKPWLPWPLLRTQEYRCLWHIYCCTLSGPVPISSCLLHPVQCQPSATQPHSSRIHWWGSQRCLGCAFTWSHSSMALYAYFTQESQPGAISPYSWQLVIVRIPSGTQGRSHCFSQDVLRLVQQECCV